MKIKQAKQEILKEWSTRTGHKMLFPQSETYIAIAYKIGDIDLNEAVNKLETFGVIKVKG